MVGPRNRISVVSEKLFNLGRAFPWFALSIVERFKTFHCASLYAYSEPQRRLLLSIIGEQYFSRMKHIISRSSAMERSVPIWSSGESCLHRDLACSTVFEAARIGTTFGNSEVTGGGRIVSSKISHSSVPLESHRDAIRAGERC